MLQKNFTYKSECRYCVIYDFFYTIDDANPKDPREKPVPPRPKGQRPEPETTGGSPFGGFGGFGGGKILEILPLSVIENDFLGNFNAI